MDQSRYIRVKPSSRRMFERQMRVYFLILCEGEKTEPRYFESIGKQLPLNTLSIIDLDIRGEGRNTKSLVNMAEIIVKDSSLKYDRVWVVFDKDDFPDRDFDNAIHKAKAKKILCAWSNEAFELWYVLHFQPISHAMPCKDYKDFIEKEFRRRGLRSYVYRKNASNMFELLEKYGNRDDANKRAKQLICNHEGETSFAKMNPCTHVFELVDEILNPEKFLK